MDDLLKLETEIFNKLYTDYRLRFIRFAQTYILDISIAEDIVMDTLAYYWEHRRDIKNDENILSYLLTAIKHYEKNNSLSELALWELDFKISALSACDPCELYTNEVQEIVNHTLEKLPSKTRQIFFMNRYEDISYPEIAKKLFVNQKTVEYHISKALKALRAVLKDYLSFLIYLI